MAQQKLGIEITGNARGLTNAISTAEGKLKAFGSKLQSVGGSLTRSLTLPLVAAGGAATKMALDFDKSMTQIKSLVGIAGDEVDAMGENVKKMALDTGKSASEAADALFFITSAGLRGDEAMQVLEASLKAAAVGLGETKTIADLATSAMNAYGSDTLSASAATDILATAVREGKLEASQLAGAMGGVIPIASNLGVGFEEVAGAMAAMSRTGTDAANGATQLNAILSSIAKPTEQSIEAFAKMGLTTDDLQKSLSEDGLMNTLVLLKNRLNATGMSFTDIVPNIRAWKGVLDLTGAGMETNIGIMRSLENHLGATERMFGITAESASFKFTQSLEQMKAPLMEVGAVLLQMLVPVVQQFAGFLRELAEKFQSLSPDMQEMIIKIAGIAAVAGPVLMLIGKIVGVFGTLSGLLPAIATGFKILTAAMMANPIIAVAAAVVALGTAIYSYTQAQKNAISELNTIEEVEAEIAKKRKKYFEENQKLAEGYGGQTRKNVEVLGNELKALEDKRDALIAIGQNQLEVEAPEIVLPKIDLPSYEVDFKPIVNPEDAQAAAEKLKALNDEINKALVTNDQKAYIQRKKDNDTYYDELIKAAAGDSEKVRSLTAAKYQSLAQIELEENQRILDIRNRIADALPMAEADRQKLEIDNIKAHYGELIRLATENGLSTEALAKEQANRIALINDTQRATALQRAKEFNEGMSQIITTGLNDLAVGIGEALGNALANGGNLAGALSETMLSTIGNMVVQLGKLAIAAGIGLEAIQEALKTLHPAVAIAAGIALVALGSFIKSSAAGIASGGSAGSMPGGGVPTIGGIPAFADGGIVSGPTLGLMGEYPGARSNPEVIAPLNKLQSLIGGGRGQNVNVGGEFVMRGSDLVVVLERANKNKSRLI